MIPNERLAMHLEEARNAAQANVVRGRDLKARTRKLFSEIPNPRKPKTPCCRSFRRRGEKRFLRCGIIVPPSLPSKDIRGTLAMLKVETGQPVA